MDTQSLDRSRQRKGQPGARGAWLLLVLAGCASEAPIESELETAGTQSVQPAQSMQPASAGSKATTMTMGTAGKSASSTNTGMAGAKAAAGGAGGAAATAGSNASAAAGSGGSGMAAAAGANGAAGSAGDMASSAAGSGGAAGASASAGMGGSTSAGSSAAGSGGGGAGGTSAGGAGAAGGASGAAGSAGGAAIEREDLGEGDGSDVVLIGDSWMSNTLQIEGTGGGIAPYMLRVSGQRYRNYGLQGVMLLEANGFGPAIPTQWNDAKRVNPEIKTVVMTAGGNDVIQGSSTLQASCQMGTDECKKKLVVISEALDKLWTQMADDGVQDIVHIRYTDNTGTLHESLRGDKGLPTPKICLSGRVRCHGVPTTDIVARSDLALDGIHPLGSANNRIAERTYDLMKSEGIRR